MEEGEIVDSEEDVSDVFRFVKPSPPTLLLPRKPWAQQAPRRHPADVRNHMEFAQRENNMHNHLYQNHYPEQRLHPMDRQYSEFGPPHRSDQNNHYSLHPHMSHPAHANHPSHPSHLHPAHPSPRPLHPHLSHPHDPHPQYSEPVRRLYADPFPPRVEVKSAYNPPYLDPRPSYPDPYLRSDTKQHYSSSHFDHYSDHPYESFPQRRLESKTNSHYPEPPYEFSRGEPNVREPQRIESRYEFGQSRPENAPSHYPPHLERYPERPPLDSMYSEFPQRSFPADRRAPFGDHDRHGSFLDPADRFLDRPSERFIDHERSPHSFPEASERSHPSFSTPPDRIYSSFSSQPERAHSAFVTTSIDRSHPSFLPPIDRSHSSSPLDRPHSFVPAPPHTFSDVRNAPYLDSSPHTFASPISERPASFSSPSDRPLFSAPNRPLFSAPPDRPLFSAPPDRPLFSAPPDRPLFSAPPDRPLFSAPPDRPLFSAPDRPPFPSVPDRPTFSVPDRPAFPSAPERSSSFSSAPDRPLFPSVPAFPSAPERSSSFSSAPERSSSAAHERPSSCSSASERSSQALNDLERSSSLDPLSSISSDSSDHSNERLRPLESPSAEPANGAHSSSSETQAMSSIPQRVSIDLTDSSHSRFVRTPSAVSLSRLDEGQSTLGNSPPLLMPYSTKKFPLGTAEALFKPRKFARPDPGPPLLTPSPINFAMDVRAPLAERIAAATMSDRIVPRTMMIQALNRGHWIPGKLRELPLNEELSKPESTARDELDLRYRKQILAFAELQQQALLLETKEIAIDRELSRIRGKTVLLSQSL